MKKVELFQVKEEYQRDYGFLRYDTLMKYGGLDVDRYETTYSCERPDDYDVEKAFVEFNIERPIDFTGYSMSVGDIIKIGDEIQYCDSFGFKRLF